MMNNKIDELIKRVGTDVSGKWISIDQAQELVKIAIAECYIAIENTNTHHVYTTFDEGMVKHTIRNSKDAVQQHFGV
jgi:hypothetical protein